MKIHANTGRTKKAGAAELRTEQLREHIAELLAGPERSELTGYGFNLARNMAEAEELVQAACFKALQYAASYDPSRPLMGWVKTILRNALYDSRRHDRLIVSLDLPSDVGDGLTLADSLADSADPVEVRMEQEGGTAALLQAVAELPKETRRVVTLCDLEGLTYEAAANQLGIPLGTVRSRLSRGRQVLREKVGQLDFA